MRILTFSTLFPSEAQPLQAVFVRSRVETFARRHGHDLTVVAPVPFWPRLPFPTKAEYDTFARVPRLEQRDGYAVHHPRYLVTPGLGMSFYGRWMAAGSRACVARLHREQPFDVIDAHYVYPDGEAAAILAGELGIPFILSARGTDLNLFPTLPRIAARIRRYLPRSARLICVCEELRAAAVRLGMPAERIDVIGNGVDVERFHRRDPVAARERLGLPAKARIVLSVGHLSERKGFHLLIEAFARLTDPDLMLAIIGDGGQRRELERLRAQLPRPERVRLVGAVANEGLPEWYGAADLFVLASSREGWPNVLCEAQACGLPAVATAVWGIPEIIRDPALGVLVPERTVDALEQGLSQALSRAWDREHIARTGRSRTWDSVADEVQKSFAAALAKP
jgi:glycosyltransferase involved in cell wall biosynthesis